MCLFSLHPTKCEVYTLEVNTGNNIESFVYPYDKPDDVITKIKSLPDNNEVIRIMVDLIGDLDLTTCFTIIPCLLMQATDQKYKVNIFPGKRFTKKEDNLIHKEARKHSKQRQIDWGWLCCVGFIMENDT
jgi:hypothetical protein